MQANPEHLIRLPILDSKETYLEGFWMWVGLLSLDDYEGAIEALYWPQEIWWTRDSLKARVTTFFGGRDPWTVVIPNDRLVKVINEASRFQSQNGKDYGWLMAQIPVTTRPDNPKNDDIPLMGLAVSFFFREHQSYYVMELELFHA